jgi:hypothetical protein
MYLAMTLGFSPAVMGGIAYFLVGCSLFCLVTGVAIYFKSQEYK